MPKGRNSNRLTVVSGRRMRIVPVAPERCLHQPAASSKASESNEGRRMHCAVIMPQPWRGGMLNFAILLSNLAAKLTIEGEPVSVSLCVPEGYDRSRIVELNSGINVIDTRMVAVSRQDATLRPFPDMYGADPFAPGYYTAPMATDGSIDIALADIWIMMTGLLPHGPLIPIKPCITYVPDMIQRLVPEIYGPDPYAPPWIINAWQILTLQRSQHVIATTAKTALDVVAYTGVPKSRVHVLPMVHAPLFDGDIKPSALAAKKKEQQLQHLLSRADAVPKQGTRTVRNRSTPGDFGAASISCSLPFEWGNTPYFLWVTNTTQHKNHKRALDALERYYTKNAGVLPCVMCGALTDHFKPDDSNPLPYIQEIRSRIRESEILRTRLTVAGELSHEHYRSALAGAAYLWHNVLYDNGTFSVIEAAHLGTRSLVSKYPQMMEICEAYQIAVQTFDPWSTEDAARQMKAMEQSLLQYGAFYRWSNPGRQNETFAAQLGRLMQTSIKFRF